MIIKDAHQLMKDNLIAKHYAGSHAYGTNLPTSDTDFRGIFCADPINIRTPFFTVKECEDVNEEDTKLYELAHFMKLAVDCNPNIVETLWVDQSDIVYAHEAFSVLQKHKHELLNKRILMTTSGYATSQLKRIKGHNKWINNPQPIEPPKQIDYVSMVHNFTDKKVFKIDLREYYKDYRLIPYDGEIYGLYPMKGYTTFNENFTLNTNYENDPQTHLEDVKWYNALLSPKRRQPHFIIKFNKEHYNEAKTKHSQYWEWKNNRNVVRSELEENYGYDTKHASHLIRLLKMSIEAAGRGEIIVKRPDAEELKAIRNGSLTYEQLIEYSDSLEAQVDILSKTCTLPSKPNYNLAAKLVMEVQDIIWSTN